MQITAGSVMGRFGQRPRYWAERMLDEGLCHLLATDAHNTEQRAPRMADARDVVAQWLGNDEAINLVLRRPQGILDNLSPAELPPLPQSKGWPKESDAAETPTLWSNILKRARRMVGAG
jgi:protein-tyrosine phosphatase